MSDNNNNNHHSDDKPIKNKDSNRNHSPSSNKRKHVDEENRSSSKTSTSREKDEEDEEVSPKKDTKESSDKPAPAHEIGKLFWVKLSGYPQWPARVTIILPSFCSTYRYKLKRIEAAIENAYLCNCGRCVAPFRLLFSHLNRLILKYTSFIDSIIYCLFTFYLIYFYS